MYSRQGVEMEAAGKLEASFPTTTSNNNNCFYTNRNAYNLDTMNDQQADAPQKESQDSTDSTDGVSELNGGGNHAVNVPLATTAEQEAQATTTANINSSYKNMQGPRRFTGNLSDTLRALLDAIKKFKRHRRPVNDFLMFCKVHRGKVSAHFTAKAAPKENRFITRKLGLWWGLLTHEQKLPYKLLADKYKAMYLAAFPDYRWGKSQHQQPQEASEAEHLATTASDDVCSSSSDAWSEDMRDGNLEAARCLLQMARGFGLPPLATFRLADETQMGSLSALLFAGNENLHSQVTLDTESSVGSMEHNYSAAQPFVNDGAEDLRVANNRGEPCANMRQHFLAQTKQKPEQAAMSSSSSTGPARATRTCKGKRYEAFMRQQHPTRPPCFPGRTARPKNTNSSSSTTITAAVTVAPADPSTSTTNRVASAGPEVGGQDLDERAILAWLSDYEKLNEEIAELPIFDLNEFLAKQKCDKRRKKPYAVSSKAARKRKTPKSSIPTPSADAIVASSIFSSPTSAPAPVPPTVVPLAVASVSPAVTAAVPATPQTSTVPAKIVGCRKRKAPKENIIRNPVV
uniref:Uncharacterized protein n=1 Tax=Anopheles atroparvus TaxID=41427 RepID=A0A182IVL5_ANOAO